MTSTTEIGHAIERAIGIDPELCRARALAHSWDESVNQFLQNLVPFPDSESGGLSQTPLPGTNQMGDDQARS